MDDYLKINPKTRIIINEGLATITVSDIMIPRSEVIVINQNQPFNEIIDLIINDGHSRYPVFSEKIDNIIGILYAKALLRFFKDDNKYSINDILRKPLFVSENKKVNELLTEFKEEHVHIAIVVDEYGTMLGIVSLEDILETIIGDINDEFDKKYNETNYVKINDKEYIIFPRITIDEFNDVFKTRIHCDDFDTIGGFIINRFGYVPKINESLKYGSYTFLIQEVEGSKIKKIYIKKNA